LVSATCADSCRSRSRRPRGRSRSASPPGAHLHRRDR
jgi:hypothetical protein